MKKILATIALMLGMTISTFSASTIYTWDAPLTNVDGTACTTNLGYKFYYGTNTSGVYTYTQDVNQSLFYTNNINSGVIYASVTAYDENLNESAFADELINCMDVPNSPTISKVAYTFKTGKVTITWLKPTKNQNGTAINNVVSYILAYGKTAGNYTLFSYFPSNVTTATISAPNNSGLWYFSMQTSNTFGKVGISSSEVSVGTSNTSPTKPKSLNVFMITL